MARDPDRSAEALRRNLRRRKDQARARAGAAESVAGGGPFAEAGAGHAAADEVGSGAAPEEAGAAPAPDTGSGGAA